MFLDPDTQPPVDALLWHSLPDESTRALQRWQIGSLVGILYKNPPTRSAESLVAIPYSLVIRRGTATILVVSLEMEDLRTLALHFGCSLRELQQEYQTKGSFAAAYSYRYAGGKRESMGPYTGGLGLEEVTAFLLEAALDIFDLVAEPRLLEGEDKAPR
ncbi:MAG: hypothetical protein RBS49_01220 [Sphaerochaeta sp.]|nr:hypothetical protein [Sphaerochaeta sp.]MDX9914482.1 hypothetical protein [Sphaerochaeta sp.]